MTRNISQEIEISRRKTFDAYTSVLDEVAHVAFHSLNPRKIAGFALMLTEMGLGHVEVTPHDSGLPEPIEMAPKVAKYKARLAQALWGIGAGSDVAFFNGRVQQHKLGRERTSLTEQEYSKLENELLSRYSPKKGIISPTWEVATAIQNGHTYVDSVKIKVNAKPIPSELLKVNLAEAHANGSLYEINARFELMETLMESGGIASIAILPKALERKGFTSEQVKLPATSNMLGIALQAIANNRFPLNY